MAHSPGYPTDNNRQPDGKERSREKQRGSRRSSRDEEALRLGKHDLYIRYSNTKYNNYFNLTSLKSATMYFCDSQIGHHISGPFKLRNQLSRQGPG